jgi:hypothetical protein
MSINYYIFDKIQRDEDGTTWGFKDGKMCEIFGMDDDSTEDQLTQNGFAKCDAPGTETFIVEESNIVVEESIKDQANSNYQKIDTWRLI